jgi:hypothetical protein
MRGRPGVPGVMCGQLGGEAPFEVALDIRHQRVLGKRLSPSIELLINSILL